MTKKIHKYHCYLAVFLSLENRENPSRGKLVARGEVKRPLCRCRCEVSRWFEPTVVARCHRIVLYVAIVKT